MDNRIEQNSYDLHITPAETAARMEREGTEYKHIPEHEVHSERKIQEASSTEGVTVDGEGLLNNYAIEPEIYYDVPGDRTAILEKVLEEEHQEIAEKERQQNQSEED